MAKENQLKKMMNSIEEVYLGNVTSKKIDGRLRIQKMEYLVRYKNGMKKYLLRQPRESLIREIEPTYLRGAVRYTAAELPGSVISFLAE